MARAALNWSVRDLADATGLHRNTITNIEVGRYGGTQESLALIESVFRSAGVEFFEENGVRLRELDATKSGQSNLKGIAKSG